MSHAQRNHELRNYESNGEHSIASGSRTQAAGATPDPLRSSLHELQALLRSRACSLSDLQLRGSYFTVGRVETRRRDRLATTVVNSLLKRASQ
jgi:hypothetical protein